MKTSVCFFVREFPVLSQTFVIQQINGLIQQGHRVQIVSVYSGEAELWELPILKKHNLRNRVKVLLCNSLRDRPKTFHIWQIISGLIFLAVKRPKLAMFILSHLRFIVKAGGIPLLFELILIAKNSDRTIDAQSVVAHFGEMGVFAALLAKMNILHNRIFTVFHGYEISEHKTFKRWKSAYYWLSEHSAKLLPISELWKTKLLELGIKRDKVEVLHMGIDLSQFYFAEASELSSPLKILSVARAVEKKGLTYSIEGLALSGMDFRYHIIGDGPLLPSLKAQAASYDCRDNFVFYGAKSPEFVALSLKQSDVFLLTSVTGENGDMEGIPVSLMEAMASGVIVLSTYHSGIPELIQDGVSGYLVPERNANAIAEKLNEIVCNSHLLDVQNAALSKVGEDFNTEKLDQKLSSLVQQL